MIESNTEVICGTCMTHISGRIATEYVRWDTCNLCKALTEYKIKGWRRAVLEKLFWRWRGS